MTSASALVSHPPHPLRANTNYKHRHCLRRRDSHKSDLQLVIRIGRVVDCAILDAAARPSHGADDLPDVVHLTKADLLAGDVADDARCRLRGGVVWRQEGAVTAAGEVCSCQLG